MLERAQIWIGYVATGVEIAAAVVIGLAALQALIRALPQFLHERSTHVAGADVRLALGRWLALGLEFALAADILRTAIAPNWQDIGQLAAIAVLRTGLNFFLEREIRAAEAR